MVIATAATTALISNATDEESFTNKALKILFVVGASILLVGTAVVILLLLDVLDAVNPFNDGGGGGFFENPFISLILTGPAYLLNSAFGRGTKLV